MNKRFILALSTFVGTVVGVGIFGLPYIAAQSGFILTILYLIALVVVSIVFHLVLSEVACFTHGHKRIPGYAGVYLGHRAKQISFIASFLSLIGAELAYMLVGGQFLYLLLSSVFGGSALLYTFIYFAVGAFFIFVGIKSIAEVELTLLAVLIILVAGFFVFALPHIQATNFMVLAGEDLLLPYGVVLFSYAGHSIVPQIGDMLGGDIFIVRRVIIKGLLLVALIYAIFIITIYGVTGVATSKEAFAGFGAALGSKVVYGGYIFGVITTFTSFLTLGIALCQMLQYDFKRSKIFSWLIACGVPLLLFFAGIDDFIEVVGVTGAVMIGIEAVIIMLVYRAFLIKQGKKFNPLYYGIIVLLVLGVIVEVSPSPPHK